MSSLLALSLSIGVLGGIWAWLALGPFGAFLLVWAGFIAWGCYFHSGGDTKALTKTICGNIYGIVIAWIALLIIFKTGAADAVIATAIVVAVTVFLLIIVASVDVLSAVPANVYGYAATVAYTLHASGAQDALTATSFDNPLIKLIVSMVLGAIFGWISGAVAKAMTKSA